MKVCSKCGIEKSFEEFRKHKKAKDGLNWWCKQCDNEYTKKWQKENSNRVIEIKKRHYEANKEKIKQRSKKQRENNKEYYREYLKNYRKENADEAKKYAKIYRKDHKDEAKKYNKEYQQTNASKINQYKKEWLREKLNNDPVFRLNSSMRRDINRSLKFNKNGKHWEDLVGYTLDDLKEHFEKQFKDGMNWNNYGKWHIDHIIPISLFNIKGVKSKGFKKCWALENLQPLWALENLRKSNKILIS